MSVVVDAHVHIFEWGYFPEAWHDASAFHWSESRMSRRDPAEIRPHVERGTVDPNGEILVKDMDRAGVDVGITLTLDWGVALGHMTTDIRDIHEHYAQLQSGAIGNLAGRFFAVAGVDPRRPGALELFEDAVTRMGMKGFKLYPPCGYFPYDDVCFPFYQRALDLNVPVVIHTAVVGWPLIGRFANPMGIGDVQVKYPDLTIVMAHSGHPIWLQEAILVASRHPRTYLELSNWNWNMKTDPEGTVRALADMRDGVGAHRILFGSDYISGPRFGGEKSDMPQWVQFIRELPERARSLGLSFSQEEIDLILGENARRVFNLEEIS